MGHLQQVLFVLLFVVAVVLFVRKVRQIRRNIRLGRPEEINDHKGRRWKRVWLLALGQKKMFRQWIPALLHLVVYAGFVIINVEILEIILDGLTGSHRLFAFPLGALYPVLIGCFEGLAVGVIIGCAVFLIRRNILKIKRFWNREMTAWPRSDANYILLMEIALMGLFLTMNTADRALQLQGVSGYPGVGPFWISGLLAPQWLQVAPATLIALERSCWWLHITGILFFLNYLPYSKHLHIILAFPNAYYGRLQPQGVMDNMPDIQREVALMFSADTSGAPETGLPEHFGAKDVGDLSWKNLMDAYTCTECGRCTQACPASQTGKLLSPRKIMMDTRDRLEVVGRNQRRATAEDGRSLLHDYITAEELRACTTCNACVEECPVSINPLDIILQLRRYLIMDEASAPAEWNAMFSNMENNGAPWKFSREDREQWMRP